MKKVVKVIAMFVLGAIIFANVLPVWAETTTAEENTTIAETTTAEEKTTEKETTTAEEKTTVEETTVDKNDDEISVTFENGETYTQYVYTGKVIKPKLTIKKEDGSIASPNEYSVEYMSDSKSTGAHHLTVTYLKSGYKAMRRYDIVPGITEKIDVKVKNGQVTISWKPVPGAGVYRVYKYDEQKGYYVEMYWSDGEIASAKTSRTFTKEELKPGGKYKMAIMALPGIEWMPTDYMAYFTVDTAKDTDASQKPVTLTKPADKPVLITPQPTKPGETAESVATTIKDETVVNPTEETVAVPENEQNAADEVDTPEYDSQENNIEEDEKDPADKTKLIIIIVVILVAVAGIVFSVYKKKK